MNGIRVVKKAEIDSKTQNSHTRDVDFVLLEKRVLSSRGQYSKLIGELIRTIAKLEARVARLESYES
jgi:hypothetical protein